MLEGLELMKQIDVWVDYGTIEPDCGEAIKKVHLYVYVCTWDIYVYVYTCIHIQRARLWWGYEERCIYTYMCAFIRTCVHLFVYVCIYTYMVRLWRRCMYTYMFKPAYAFIRTCLCVHIHIEVEILIDRLIER